VKDVVGVVLAGGYGTRLLPLTLTTNKHLIPVYNKHMILYPIDTLVKSGITEILIITGRDKRGASMAGQFVDLLGGDDKDRLGELLGRKIENRVNFHYKLQEQAGGIAQAIGMAERFVGNANLFAILGDNIVQDDVSQKVKEFANAENEAHIFLKHMSDEKMFEVVKGERRAKYGVADVDGNKIKGIEEKPVKPKSSYAVTGLYMYTPDVFGIVKNLKTSWRGELEVSEINDHYAQKGRLGYTILNGLWLDLGIDHDSILDGAIEVRKMLHNTAP
jgi:glucose-1-phosphate thymidylyltransferase